MLIPLPLFFYVLVLSCLLLVTLCSLFVTVHLLLVTFPPILGYESIIYIEKKHSEKVLISVVFAAAKIPERD